MYADRIDPDEWPGQTSRAVQLSSGVVLDFVVSSVRSASNVEIQFAMRRCGRPRLQRRARLHSQTSSSVVFDPEQSHSSQRNVFGSAVIGRGEDTMMARRIMQGENLRAISVSLAILAALSNTADAFEVRQESKGLTHSADDPAPVIKLDEPIGKLAIASCEPIRPEIEMGDRRMHRLPEPLVKDGQQFEWQIGRESGTTYWHRKRLGNGLQQITLYFAKLDLILQFNATSILSVTSDSELDVLPISNDWLLGLWFTLVDETTHEGLLVEYKLASRKGPRGTSYRKGRKQRRET